MSGQTLPQPEVFRSLVKKSVNLPEIHTEEDEWFCNRLINEALLETNHHGKGPVHINVPVSEPLFNFTTEALPQVRVITRYQGLNVYDRDYNELIDRMNKYRKRMIVVGQMNLIYLFEKRYTKLLYKHFAWLTEHIGNRTVPGIPVKNFDAALYAMPEDKMDQMAPELLITYGGHIVSKRLKKYLRRHPPKEHWHVSPDGEVTDLYGSLTTVIEMDPFEFLEKIAALLETRTPEYPRIWEDYCVDKVLAGSIGTASGKQFGGALCPVVCRFAHRRGLLQPGNQRHRRFAFHGCGVCGGIRQAELCCYRRFELLLRYECVVECQYRSQPAHPFTE